MEARKEKIDQHISTLFGGPGVFHEEKPSKHVEGFDYEGILLDDVFKAQRNSLIPIIECG